MRKITFFVLFVILSVMANSLFAQGQSVSFTTDRSKGDVVKLSVLGEGKCFIQWENGIKEPFLINQGEQNVILQSSSFKIGTDNGKLEWIYCKNDELTNLDLSNAPDLSYLSCTNNKIEELNTSKNLKLKNLYCAKNNLKKLDLSANFSLKNLDCSENQLVDLNVAKNSKLVKLICNTNKLTSLSLEGKDNLTKIYCFENDINEANMEVIVKALNATEDKKEFSPVQEGSKFERNVCTATQVKVAKDKMWSVGYYDVSGNWIDFKGNKGGGTSEDKFTVTIAPSENGKVEITEKLDLTSVAKGTMLHVTVLPNVGYKLVQLTANDKDIMEAKSFIVDSNVVVKAVFEKTKTYLVTLKSDGNGTISIKGYPDEMLKNVAEGVELTVLDDPKAGYRLETLTANGEDILSKKTFVVKANTEVKATFASITYAVVLEQPVHGKMAIKNYTEEQLKQIPIGTKLEVEVTPDKGFRLSTLTANNEDILKTMNFVVTEKTTVRATFEAITHKVSITINGNGTVYIVGMSGTDLNKVPEGKELTVNAKGKNEKCVLTKLTANDIDIMQTKKFVVDKDVVVYAEFVDHTSINSVAEDAVQVTLTTREASIKAQPGNLVCLYDINGRLIQEAVVPAEAEMIFNLSNLNEGVYIIKVASKQVKFVK